MKNLLCFIIGLMCILPVRGESIKVDSILVYGFPQNFDSMVSIGRVGFIDRERDSTVLDDDWRIVDTIITHKSEIDSLILLLDNLEVQDTLSFSSEKLELTGHYSSLTKEISWWEPNSLDNRLVIILFTEDTTKFVWLSDLLLDKDKYRYWISRDLMMFLSKYTHIYDSIIRKECL